MREGRFKQSCFDLRNIPRLLTALGGSDHLVVVGMPRDAKVVEVIRVMDSIVTLVFESESWDLVPRGTLLPEIDIVIHNITEKEALRNGREE